MAPTEQIFWEAKQKPSSLRGSRRASTVIDASGCKVTRGFLLPSRPSSRNSSASSHDADLMGAPASPVEIASPGFFRPTGSLYHAPEMAILRSDSDSSLHKPSRLDALLRPPQLGGRSQTFHGRLASCWYDAGPDTTTFLPASESDKVSPNHHVKLQKSIRRTQSDHTGLISTQAAAIAKKDTLIAGTASECAISDAPEEEDAIASGSEDDDDDFLPVSGIAAQRNRPTYAQRRAMSDQRVERQEYLPPLPHKQPVPQVVIGTTIRRDFAVFEADVETPIEVKSFACEEILPQHALRPSRSRPQPMKGVLKAGGSRSSSEDSVKHVRTAIGRDGGAAINGKAVYDPASQME